MNGNWLMGFVMEASLWPIWLNLLTTNSFNT